MAMLSMFFTLKVGDVIDRQELIRKLLLRQYQRNSGPEDWHWQYPVS